MPDEIREGDEPDVNSDAGFQAALAKAAGTELSSEKLAELEGSERSVAAGLTFEESAPRDELGRFAPKGAPGAEDAPAEGAAPAAAEAEGQQEGEEVDPILQLASSLLGKHEGNAEAAVAEALQNADEHAQSLIGKQSNEVGDLRKQLEAQAQEIAELRGYQKARAEQPAPPAARPGLPSDAEVNGIANMAAERGWRSAMQWIVQNREDLFETALEMWGVDEPYVAAQVGFAYQQEKSKALAGPPAVSEDDPLMNEWRLERQVTSAVEQVRAAVPANAWDVLKPYVGDAFESAGPTIQQMVISNDQKLRDEGVGILVQLAQGKVVAAATAEARKAATEAAAPVKKATMVATGSHRPVDERQPGSGDKALTTEEVTAAFHKRLLATDTTSVRDGLTFGPALPV